MPEAAPWKLLLWTAVAGLIFGFIGLGEIAEDWLRVARNNFHKHSASGDVVILAIDDKSLHEIGNWPWPRSVDGQLVDRLTAVGAKRIFFDVNFSFVSNPQDDDAFADAIKRSGHVISLRVRRPGPSVKPRKLTIRSFHFPSLRGMRSSAPLASSTTIKMLFGRCNMRLAAARHDPIVRIGHRRCSGIAQSKLQGRLFDRSANHSLLFRRRRSNRPYRGQGARGKGRGDRHRHRRHRRFLLHSRLRQGIRDPRPCDRRGDAKERASGRSRLGLQLLVRNACGSADRNAQGWTAPVCHSRRRTGCHSRGPRISRSEPHLRRRHARKSSYC